MNEQKIKQAYELAVERYASLGVDVEKAMEPLFTTGGEERSGLGFSVMESFTDRLRVKSTPGKGTTVTMDKYIALRVRGR